MSKLDTFQENPKCRWDLRGDLVITHRIMSSEEVSTAPLPGQFQISFGKLYTPSFENDLKYLCSAVKTYSR